MSVAKGGLAINRWNAAAKTAEKIRLLSVALCAAFVMLPSMLTAQQGPRQLTLEDALDLASRNNPAYRRAVAQADASGADVMAGIGGLLPDLRASLSFSGWSRTVFTGTDDFGRPVETDESTTFKSSSSSQSLNSSITVFDGFRNLNNLRGARAGASSSRASVDAEAIRLEAEIKRRFYQVLQAQMLAVIEEELLASRVRDHDATDRLFRVGARTQVDVLGAEVEVASQEQQLETARGSVRRNKLLLAEWIGLEETTEFEVVGILPDVFDPMTIDGEAIVARVLETNPEIRQATASAAQARFSTNAAQAGRWPTISANAGFSRQLSDEGYSGMFQLDPRDRSFSFGMSVSFPVFNRFQTSQSIARAKAAEGAAEETLRETRLRVEREVRSSIIDVQNSYLQVVSAQRSADLGRQRLEMAQEQYQLGSIGFTELQQVMSQASATGRAALNALGSWTTALVALEAVVGQQVRP